MSQEVKARRAEIAVKFGGVDITDDIRPYLISLTYTDSEEDESDDLQIQLQDRDAVWLMDWLEKAVQGAAASKLTMNAIITPVNWGHGGGALPTGSFELDSVDASGPPGVVSIKGASLAYGSNVRQTKKSKAWEGYSLSGIAQEIAGNAGLGCMYQAENNPTYDRKEQTKKSDITFLDRLKRPGGKTTIHMAGGLAGSWRRIDAAATVPELTKPGGAAERSAGAGFLGSYERAGVRLDAGKIVVPTGRAATSGSAGVFHIYQKITRRVTINGTLEGRSNHECLVRYVCGLVLPDRVRV